MTISVLAPTSRLECLPRPLSFPCLRQLSPSTRLISSTRLIPHHQTKHCSGAVSKFPKPDRVCRSRWFPCWRFSCSSWFGIRKGRSRSTVACHIQRQLSSVNSGSLPFPPTRVPETTPASSSRRDPELFWKGGAQTPRQGLLSAFPGLASLAHAALCPSSPLHQRAMLHYPRLVHHLPQRSGRTGKKKKLADHGTVQHPAPSIAMLHRGCLSMHRGDGGLDCVVLFDSPSIHSAAKQQSALCGHSASQPLLSCSRSRCCPNGSACPLSVVDWNVLISSPRGKTESGSAVVSWETLRFCDQRGRIVQDATLSVVESSEQFWGPSFRGGAQMDQPVRRNSSRDGSTSGPQTDSPLGDGPHLSARRESGEWLALLVNASVPTETVAICPVS